MKRKSLPTGRDFLFVEGYGNENPGAFQSPRPLRGATTTGSKNQRAIPHFNPRAPCGARRSGARSTIFIETFQSPRPLRGATGDRRGRRQRDQNFNPRAPCGARHRQRTRILVRFHFNPRAPCGARQHGPLRRRRNRHRFQPTRPLRGATIERIAGEHLFEISTHAPLTGRDQLQEMLDNADDISTHAPLTGRDAP